MGNASATQAKLPRKSKGSAAAATKRVVVNVKEEVVNVKKEATETVEKPVEMMSLQAYSLNTPKDEALTIEIPIHATYDIVVEKLKLGLFKGGISQAYNDVKVFKVLCAGKKLQFREGRHDILGGKPIDYYAFAGYPLLFKYFSYRNYCRDHPEYPFVFQLAVHLGESSWTMDVEASDTFDTLLEKIHQTRQDIAVPKLPKLTINGCRMPRKDKALLDMRVKPGSTVVITDDLQYEFQVNVKTLTEKIIPLIVTADDTIIVMKKKLQDSQGIPHDQQRLVYGGRQLEDRHTVEHYGIKRRSTVHLILRLRGGGGPQVFGDVSGSGDVTLIAWSTNAPSWRRAGRGLCLEGECRNTACKAYSQMVIMNKRFTDFDLVRDSGTTWCPECFERVTPRTCAFNSCMWAFDGKKTGEDKITRGDWKRVGNEYYRFNESTGVEWDRLLLRARKDPNSVKPSVTAEKSNETSQVVVVKIDYAWDVCTICLKGVENGTDDRQILDCGHHFHSECISKWQGSCKSKDVSCPNCRCLSKFCRTPQKINMTSQSG